MCIEHGGNSDSSDSESDISEFYEVPEGVDGDLCDDTEASDSSIDEDTEDEGIQPYRFEPEASDTDEEAQPADHAVAYDIDRLQNTEW